MDSHERTNAIGAAGGADARGGLRAAKEKRNPFRFERKRWSSFVEAVGKPLLLFLEAGSADVGEAAEAHAVLERGENRGKVVLTLAATP